MPKSRRRYIPKKKISNKKKPKPYEVIKHKFVQFETPSLEHIPFDEKTKAICEIGINASIEFENEYVKLINYFENYDALYLCSFSSYYFMKQKEGIDEEAINGHIEFPPFFFRNFTMYLIKIFEKDNGKTTS